MDVKRTGILLTPSNTRVVIRPFWPGSEERATKIIARVLTLSEADVDRILSDVMRDFSHRHKATRAFFLRRFQNIKSFLLTDQDVSENRRMLIGSYFSQEYALESAALFNPSMVWHPDQSSLPAGSRRFIISLRATGEGHLSSITFRSGVVDKENRIRIDPPTRHTTEPELVPNSLYEKRLFSRKLSELGVDGPFTQQIMNQLGDHFTIEELQRTLRNMELHNREHRHEIQVLAKEMNLLARSNYEIRFSADQPLSERIIFPSSPSETNGIEDARFVQFVDEDGAVLYYSTYTAFDGKVILPQMIETGDFLHFKISTLNGPAVKNKGFALFPRKIRGQYCMLSRQDNENIYLMYSDSPHFWYSTELVSRPTEPWEFVQLGNCGSPIQTEAGWLVLTHGVGPMRTYAMGAILLELENPARIIGRLRSPLLAPDVNEREGYVPNVVYSCGGLLHGRELILPYAISDYASSFATVGVDELLSEMKRF